MPLPAYGEYRPDVSDYDRPRATSSTHELAVTIADHVLRKHFSFTRHTFGGLTSRDELCEASRLKTSRLKK